ncbi:MAG: 50S ribosomal protein L17 [Proteobacteria bacterium]|nr:50S ribosomal protein L17 [Pseudomonadota bacterium]
MRHLKAGKRLGVTTSHRKAMMRNLVTSLLENGEIKTTITRAKEMRKYFDKMIVLGKKNTLHSRRQALAFVRSDDAILKLFEEYGPLYKDRSGGYTRIYRLANRLGDNAQLALIQMVGIEPAVKKAKPKDDPIEEVKEDLEKDIAKKPAVERAAEVKSQVETKESDEKATAKDSNEETETAVKKEASETENVEVAEEKDVKSENPSGEESDK